MLFKWSTIQQKSSAIHVHHFQKKIRNRAFDSLSPPPTPLQTFVHIWGRSETQTIKLEAHSAQIEHNWYHFRPKILNWGQWTVPNWVKILTFQHRFSDVKLSHVRINFWMQNLTHVPTDFKNPYNMYGLHGYGNICGCSLVCLHMLTSFVSLERNIALTRRQNTDIGWNRLMLHCYARILRCYPSTLECTVVTLRCYVTYLYRPLPIFLLPTHVLSCLSNLHQCCHCTIDICETFETPCILKKCKCKKNLENILKNFWKIFEKKFFF